MESDSEDLPTEDYLECTNRPSRSKEGSFGPFDRRSTNLAADRKNSNSSSFGSSWSVVGTEPSTSTESYQDAPLPQDYGQWEEESSLNYTVRSGSTDDDAQRKDSRTEKKSIISRILSFIMPSENEGGETNAPGTDDRTIEDTEDAGNEPKEDIKSPSDESFESFKTCKGGPLSRTTSTDYSKDGETGTMEFDGQSRKSESKYPRVPLSYEREENYDAFPASYKNPSGSDQQLIQQDDDDNVYDYQRDRKCVEPYLEDLYDEDRKRVSTQRVRWMPDNKPIMTDATWYDPIDTKTPSNVERSKSPPRASYPDELLTNRVDSYWDLSGRRRHTDKGEGENLRIELLKKRHMQLKIESKKIMADLIAERQRLSSGASDLPPLPSDVEDTEEPQSAPMDSDDVSESQPEVSPSRPINTSHMHFTDRLNEVSTVGDDDEDEDDIPDYLRVRKYAGLPSSSISSPATYGKSSESVSTVQTPVESPEGRASIQKERRDTEYDLKGSEDVEVPPGSPISQKPDDDEAQDIPRKKSSLRRSTLDAMDDNTKPSTTVNAPEVSRPEERRRTSFRKRSSGRQSTPEDVKLISSLWMAGHPNEANMLPFIYPSMSVGQAPKGSEGVKQYTVMHEIMTGARKIERIELEKYRRRSRSRSQSRQDSSSIRMSLRKSDIKVFMPPPDITNSAAYRGAEKISATRISDAICPILLPEIIRLSQGTISPSGSVVHMPSDDSGPEREASTGSLPTRRHSTSISTTEKQSYKVQIPARPSSSWIQPTSRQSSLSGDSDVTAEVKLCIDITLARDEEPYNEDSVSSPS